MKIIQNKTKEKENNCLIIALQFLDIGTFFVELLLELDLILLYQSLYGTAKMEVAKGLAFR